MLNLLTTFNRSDVKCLLTFFISTFLFLFVSYAHAACTVSTTPVNFGSYDMFSPAPCDSTSSITIDCSIPPPPPNPPVDVLITIGQSPNSGSFIPRSMRNISGSDLLNYNLYTNSSRTSVWGDGTGGTSIITLNNVNRNAPPRVMMVYGRISTGQDVSAGSYSDTLVVTITW
jgi:spore coat protein U domain-containing protein, fimbrial subunit CupE1/2/3/6